MERLRHLWVTEPARVVGYVLAALAALLDLLVVLGVAVPDEAKTAMTTLLTMLLALITGGTELIRSQVYAPATVKNHLGYIPPSISTSEPLSTDPPTSTYDDPDE